MVQEISLKEFSEITKVLDTRQHKMVMNYHMIIRGIITVGNI